jgi:thiol-disulfide isomerase/thioredoxin
MAKALIAFLLLFAGRPLLEQDPSPPKQPSEQGPTNEKAKKTYKDALEYLHQGKKGAALDLFKKADKQDDGHCADCQQKMLKYGLELRDWKAAELATQEKVSEAQGNRQLAVAEYDVGWVFMEEGLDKHKDEFFARAHDEFTKALATYPNFPGAVFTDGQALGRLNKDDAAKAQFQAFLKLARPDDFRRKRAQRYIEEPGLVRARMVPAFEVTTIDGQRVSLDDLQGKVVLLDFWATWCEPCRAALPHVREIAKKFEGQPLIILSVSLDSDETRWKEFVASNGMTWLNYRDGRFTGPLCKLFDVTAIPHTFTIDADGILQDEQIGDASLEGRLKKLVAKARTAQPAPQQAAP